MGVLDTLSDVTKLAHDVKNIDLYRQLVALQREVMDQQEELRRAIAERDKLNDQLRDRNHLYFTRNAYWPCEPNADGSGPSSSLIPGAPPVCSRCFDVEGKRVNLHETNRYSDSTAEIYKCPACSTLTGKPPAVRLSETQRRRPR